MVCFPLPSTFCKDWRVNRTDQTIRSSLILLSAIHPSNAKPVQLGHGFAYQPSLAMLIVTGYQVYYMLLEPVAGVSFRLALNGVVVSSSRHLL